MNLDCATVGHGHSNSTSMGRPKQVVYDVNCKSTVQNAVQALISRKWMVPREAEVSWCSVKNFNTSTRSYD